MTSYIRLKSDEEYKPELLREPYLLSSAREDLTLKMETEMLVSFNDILANLNDKDYVDNFKNDLKRLTLSSSSSSSSS